MNYTGKRVWFLAILYDKLTNDVSKMSGRKYLTGDGQVAYRNAPHVCTFLHG